MVKGLTSTFTTNATATATTSAIANVATADESIVAPTVYDAFSKARSLSV